MWKSVERGVEREDVGRGAGGVWKCWVKCGKVCWVVGKLREDMGGSVKERCGKMSSSVGEVEEMWRSAEKCVGVWGRSGEVWESGESMGRDVGGVGKGEGKCRG